MAAIITNSKIYMEKADITQLEELLSLRREVLREVFKITDDKLLNTLTDANREYYLHALVNGEHSAFLARLSGEAVGCGGICFYSEMPSPDNPTGKCAYLMNIYTKPTMRGDGIGSSIVGHLLKEAWDSTAGKIYLEASEQAYPLYKKFGFDDMEWYLKYPR